MSVAILVCVVHRQLRWKVQGIVPALGFQYHFSLISVVVEQCFQVCFVVIGVGLRTDKGAIESLTDLFEQSVGRIFCGPEFRDLLYVVAILQFECQLNL